MDLSSKTFGTILVPKLWGKNIVKFPNVMGSLKFLKKILYNIKIPLDSGASMSIVHCDKKPSKATLIKQKTIHGLLLWQE